LALALLLRARLQLQLVHTPAAPAAARQPPQQRQRPQPPQCLPGASPAAALAAARELHTPPLQPQAPLEPLQLQAPLVWLPRLVWLPKLVAATPPSRLLLRPLPRAAPDRAFLQSLPLRRRLLLLLHPRWLRARLRLVRGRSLPRRPMGSLLRRPRLLQSVRQPRPLVHQQRKPRQPRQPVLPSPPTLLLPPLWARQELEPNPLLPLRWAPQRQPPPPRKPHLLLLLLLLLSRPAQRRLPSSRPLPTSPQPLFRPGPARQLAARQARHLPASPHPTPQALSPLPAPVPAHGEQPQRPPGLHQQLPLPAPLPVPRYRPQRHRRRQRAAPQGRLRPPQQQLLRLAAADTPLLLPLRPPQRQGRGPLLRLQPQRQAPPCLGPRALPPQHRQPLQHPQPPLQRTRHTRQRQRLLLLLLSLSLQPP